jgi:hypothetical protein
VGELPRPPEARIQFAKVEPTTIAIADLADAIRESLVPGTATERYERIWRMGQFDEVDNYVFGRIGFEAAGVTELWNADINDFQEARLPAGTTAPFALNLDLGELAFQRRPSKGIRPQSFVGAFQALLNDASAFTSWRVRQESRKVEWGDWVASVDRLTQLRFRLERPNPDWKGRERVEAIIEGANAALMDAVLQADDNALDGLDISDATVHQFIEHASKYGRFQAEAERVGEADPVIWHSDEEVVPERRIDADPETGEARPDGLRRELDEYTSGSEATDALEKNE